MPFFVILLMLFSLPAQALPEGLTAWFIRPIIPLPQPAAAAHDNGDTTHRAGPIDIKLEGQSDNLEMKGLEITAQGVRIESIRAEARVRKITIRGQRIVADLPTGFDFKTGKVGKKRIEAAAKISTIHNFSILLASRGPILIPMPEDITLVVSKDATQVNTRFRNREAVLDHFRQQIASLFTEAGFGDNFFPPQTSVTGFQKEVFDYLMTSRRQEFVNQLKTAATHEIERPAFLERLEQELGRSIRSLNLTWEPETEIVLRKTWLPISKISKQNDMFGAVAAWKLTRLDSIDQVPNLNDIAPLESLGSPNFVTVTASEKALESLLAEQIEKNKQASMLGLQSGVKPKKVGYTTPTSEEGAASVRKLFQLASEKRHVDLWTASEFDGPDVEIEPSGSSSGVRVGITCAPVLSGIMRSAAPPQKLWFDFAFGSGMNMELKQVQVDAQEGSEVPASGFFKGIADKVQQKVLSAVIREELARKRDWASPTDIGVLRPFDVRALPNSDRKESYLAIDMRIDGLVGEK